MPTSEINQNSPVGRARYKLLVVIAAAIVYIATFHLWPVADSRQAVVAATLLAVIILWITEIIPLYISALTGSFLLLSHGDFSATDIFQPYFDPVIVLFLGGFTLARGLQKYRIDHRLAHEILKRMGDNPLIFVLGMMLVTAFLSMWMSNTASAAIMIPISIIVLKENNLFHEQSRFAKASVLAVAYAATIGGIGSLVGSPPNAIAARYLNESNISLDFVEWMVRALPFVVLALFFTWFLLFLINRPEIDKIKFAYKASKLKLPQKLILAVFIITVAGWLTTAYTGLSSATVALFPVIALFGLRLLDESDLGQISWPTLLLFGGGLSLGSAINRVGIDSWLVSFIESWVAGIPQLTALLILVFFGIFVTMIASNTASAAILIPLMLPLSTVLGIDTRSIVMLIAIAVSLDFMMPVGTPPSAIAYSTGIVNVREMIRNGFLVNIGTGLLLVCLFYVFYL